MFCVPESFNKNILNQLLDYKITFVSSQPENTNSKGDFIPENWFKMFVERFLVYKNKSDLVSV